MQGVWELNDNPPALKERVLAALRDSPGRKASELAQALGVERKTSIVALPTS